MNFNKLQLNEMPVNSTPDGLPSREYVKDPNFTYPKDWSAVDIAKNFFLGIDKPATIVAPAQAAPAAPSIPIQAGVNSGVANMPNNFAHSPSDMGIPMKPPLPANISSISETLNPNFRQISLPVNDSLPTSTRVGNRFEDASAVTDAAKAHTGLGLTLDNTNNAVNTFGNLKEALDKFIGGNDTDSLRARRGFLAAVKSGVQSFGVGEENLSLLTHYLSESDKQLEAQALQAQIQSSSASPNSANPKGGAETAVGERTNKNGVMKDSSSTSGKALRKTSKDSKNSLTESDSEAPASKKLSRENIFSGLLKTFTGQISDGELRVLRDAAEHAKAKQLQDEKLFAEDKRLNKTLDFQKYQTDIKAELDKLGIKVQVADLGLRTYQAVNQATNLTKATDAQAASLYSSAELNRMHALAAGIIQVQPENLILRASKSPKGGLNLENLTPSKVSTQYLNALTNMQHEVKELANFYMENFYTENATLAKQLALDAIEKGPIAQGLEALEGTSFTVNEIVDGKMVSQVVDTKKFVEEKIINPAINNMEANFITVEPSTEWDANETGVNLDYRKAFINTLGYDRVPQKPNIVSFTREGYAPTPLKNLTPDSLEDREKLMRDVINTFDLSSDVLQLNPKTSKRLKDKVLRDKAIEVWDSFYTKLNKELTYPNLVNYLAHNSIGAANLATDYSDTNIASKTINQVKKGETIVIRGIPFKCVNDALKVGDKKFTIMRPTVRPSPKIASTIPALQKKLPN